jgi:glycosyltransferase involved in cell wall biosynthesis
VHDGESGLLVPPGDARAIGDALSRLAASPSLRRQLGEAAKAFVTPRFGVDGYVASVTRLYDGLLQEQGHQ